MEEVWTKEIDKVYLIKNITNGNIVFNYHTYQGNTKKAIFATKENAQKVINNYLSDIYSVVEIEV